MKTKQLYGEIGSYAIFFLFLKFGSSNHDGASDAEQNIGLFRVVGDDSDCFALATRLATGVESDVDFSGLTLGQNGLFGSYSGATTRSFDFADNEVLLALVGDNKIGLYLFGLSNLSKVVRNFIDFELRGFIRVNFGEILLDGCTDGNLVFELAGTIERDPDAVGHVAPVILLRGIV